ncbi:hypothetical protein LTR10_000194 [Elasticomyces elasticus]|nr:hypothetical protein LTR10_000194 [Elasticomyces elasticus]KAK4980547.1 hypothetical protein LTR42_000855 [Elasticomyces elasticus]
MSDTEQPPPYASYEALDAPKAFIVNTHRYTLGPSSPQGKASWGNYLGQKNDAITITPNMTLAQLSTRLGEGAGITMTLDSQVVNPRHEDTWLACRKLLLTREGGFITYYFAIQDSTSPSQVPAQQHTQDKTSAVSMSPCRYSLWSVLTSFGRLFRGSRIPSDPGHNKPANHKPERQSSHETFDQETPDVQDYVGGGATPRDGSVQQVGSAATSDVISSGAEEASVEGYRNETDEDRYWMRYDV